MSPCPYTRSARDYWRNGWVNPLPIIEKSTPPKGFTGGAGKPVTHEHLNEWLTFAKDNPERAEWNIGLRSQGSWIGLDVDHYDDKRGLDTLEAAESELGPLPAAWRTSSRGAENPSGIRYFMIPPGIDFTGAEDKLVKRFGPNVEVIHKFHRYAVVAPSVHPSGREYRWWSPSGNSRDGHIPSLGDIPDLPEAWVAFLAADEKVAAELKTTRAKRAAGVDVSHDKAKQWLAWDEDDLPAGEWCIEVAAAADRTRLALEEMSSRHATMLAAVQEFCHLHAEGHVGARSAMKAFLGLWLDVVGRDSTRTQDTSVEIANAVKGGVRIARAFHPDDPSGDPCTATDFDPGDDGLSEPADAGLPADARAVDGRRKVDVRSGPAAQDWLLEELGRRELSGVFRRDNMLVHTPLIGEEGYVPPARAGDQDGAAQVRPLSVIQLRARIEIRYSVGVNHWKDADDHSKGKRWERKHFPKQASEGAWHGGASGEGAPNLKELLGVTVTPVIGADGQVFDRPGYDDASGLLFLPDPSCPGMDSIQVPQEPTAEEIAKAVELILLPVRDFPFVTEEHRANWVGAMLTPLLRPILPPPYQLVVFDAPMPGSGKSYLSMLLRQAHGGVLRTEFPKDNNEVSKSIGSILSTTTGPVVTFDNVRGAVKSSALEALLTERYPTARILGVTQEVPMVNDRLWTITANNAALGGDLSRRTMWVTIDPAVPDPHLRSGFGIANLRAWMPEHRAAYLTALLTVCRAWAVAGQPHRAIDRQDNYADWLGGVGGLMDLVGLPAGFGSGQEQGSRGEASEDDEWAEFLYAVYEVMGTRTFYVKELVQYLDAHTSGPNIPVEALPAELADKFRRYEGQASAGFVKSLGRWLQVRNKRYVGAGRYRVVALDMEKAGRRYVIERHSSLAEPISDNPDDPFI